MTDPREDSESSLLRSNVARGWESKSVESQQDEARAQGPSVRGDRRGTERGNRKAGLEMALVQTQSECGAACRPAHREMLRLRLDAIQAEIRDL